MFQSNSCRQKKIIHHVCRLPNHIPNIITNKDLVLVCFFFFFLGGREERRKNKPKNTQCCHYWMSQKRRKKKELLKNYLFAWLNLPFFFIFFFLNKASKLWTIHFIHQARNLYPLTRLALAALFQREKTPVLCCVMKCGFGKSF